ncbi:MAG: ABC transporter ATP-binding protein [Cyanophyceae cyanobacterium]
MAQVILENVYKSFPSRSGEVVTASSSPVPLPAFKADDRSAKPRRVNVLRCINLTIADGEFMVLVGPSGCGKSTLLRVIAGLESLTGGNIRVGDRTVNSLAPKERDIAMVFQNYALYPHLDVYDNLAFGLRRTGNQTQKGTSEHLNRHDQSLAAEWLVKATRPLPKSLRYLTERERAIDERVHKVAQLLQIEPLLHRLPKQLSGGQKQRVALGRAIARNPQVFLMDEPLSNLDAKLRTETRSQIVKLQRQLGTTTIYVTHDQTEAMTMGDRIAVMNEGEIQQIAAPLELYNRPANRFVAEFIGSPPMNFIPVKFAAPLLITHHQFRCTLAETWFEALAPYDGRSLLLGVRPEHFSLSRPAPKNLSVQVDLVEALGNDTYLSVHPVDEPEFSLQVRISPENQVRRGEKIWLSLDLDKIHFFNPQTNHAIRS